MNKRLASRYIDFLKKSTDYSEESLEEIRYVFLSLLSESQRLVLLSLIFGAFGLIKPFLLCLIALVFTRSQSGGLHCKTFWGCFFVSFMIFISAIVVLPGIAVSQTAFLLIMLLNIGICMMFAPVQSPNRPKMSAKKRRKSKIITTASVAVIFAFLLLIGEKNSPVFWIVFLQNIQLFIGGIYHGKEKWFCKKGVVRGI
ncbi:MAG: accessory gene regulator B family protein [Oscillospiraceae bacterium]|nr:accessory gene regulator B family protein [Oscillospiraceae bacterium]